MSKKNTSGGRFGKRKMVRFSIFLSTMSPVLGSVANHPGVVMTANWRAKLRKDPRVIVYKRE